MTQGPQEELKAVKARARKAAEKARAQIAKEKQTVMVLARDADRAREEARKARVIGNFAPSNFGKIGSTKIGKIQPSTPPKFGQLKMCL